RRNRHKNRCGGVRPRAASKVGHEVFVLVDRLTIPRSQRRRRWVTMSQARPPRWPRPGAAAQSMGHTLLTPAAVGNAAALRPAHAVVEELRRSVRCRRARPRRSRLTPGLAHLAPVAA